MAFQRSPPGLSGRNAHTPFAVDAPTMPDCCLWDRPRDLASKMLLPLLGTPSTLYGATPFSSYRLLGRALPDPEPAETLVTPPQSGRAPTISSAHRRVSSLRGIHLSRQTDRHPAAGSSLPGPPRSPAWHRARGVGRTELHNPSFPTATHASLSCQPWEGATTGSTLPRTAEAQTSARPTSRQLSGGAAPEPRPPEAVTVG